MSLADLRLGLFGTAPRVGGGRGEGLARGRWGSSGSSSGSCIDQHMERIGRRRQLVDAGKLGHGADDGQRHHVPASGRSTGKHRRPRAALRSAR